MKRRQWLFALQLGFTLLVCGFLIVPVVLSMLAGLTVNYLIGIESGLTLRWVVEVWAGYRDTIFASVGLSLPHRDPADRMIAATARLIDARLVTADEVLRGWAGVETIW